MASHFAVGLIDLRMLVTGSVIVLVLYALQTLFLRHLWSPLHKLPGPGRGHWLYGHFPLIYLEPVGVHIKQWTKQYGNVIRFFGPFGQENILLADPKAIHHVLVSHVHDFPKNRVTTKLLVAMFGRGITTVEGEEHKRHRRVLSPAFTPSHIASLTPIFFEKAQLLVEKLKEELSRSRGQIVDVEPWMSKCTIDIIGAAGFSYDFGALEGKTNAFGETFSDFIKAAGRQRFSSYAIPVLVRVYPRLAKLPIRAFRIQKQRMDTMQRETQQILENKKLVDPEHQGRDLLSQLLRANESESPKTALTDEELRTHVITFTIAGSETTATALTFALHAMSEHCEVQASLREEVRKAGLQGASSLPFEQLNALPLLDAVTKETLRLYSPAQGVRRQARHDTVIPLSQPLPDGSTSLFVPGGTPVQFSFVDANENVEYWSEDGAEFRPSRWTEGISERVKETTAPYALWSSLMTFGAGPQSCAGYRFAVAEFKAILATLIANFDVSPGLAEGEEIVKIAAFVTKPFISNRRAEGAQMPLRIKAVL